MDGGTRKQYIFQSCYTSAFNAVGFEWRAFHTLVRKRLKGFKFCTFVGRKKWHHGSEGVKLLLGAT